METNNPSQNPNVIRLREQLLERQRHTDLRRAAETNNPLVPQQDLDLARRRREIRAAADKKWAEEEAAE